MQKLSSLAGILALALVFIGANVATQKTNFSGTWTFKEQTSISGNLYSNGSPKQIKIDQHEKEIAIQKTSLDEKGEDFTQTDSLRFEGAPFEKITKSKRKKKISIQWTDDGKGFTATTSIFSAADNSKMEFQFTDRFSMEEGKLILIRKAENFENGESWESRSTYEKGTGQ